MSNPIARRYAEALYEEAERREEVAAVDEDVAMLRESLEASGELARFFESPIIAEGKKHDVMEALFEERVHPLTLRFLHLLVEKQREALLANMLSAYRALRDEQEGIVEVRVRTAQPFEEDDQASGREQLVRRLEAMTGRQVRLRTQEDEALLGGLVVRIGDTVYDGSVRRQLQRLHEQMRHGAV